MRAPRIPFLGSLLASALLSTGCDGASDSSSSAALHNAPPASTSPVDRPHVVFSERRLTIDRLGVPIALPVSTASSPSPQTLVSEDPAVASVSSSGALIASKPGRTKVRALLGGSTLEVEVRAPASIRVEPSRLELAPLGSAPLRLVDAETGQPLAAEAATWRSDAPQRAVVRDAVVYAGEQIGPVRVFARYGETEAAAEVVVARQGGVRLTPERARLRRGDVTLFRALGSSGEVRAEWASRNGQVLAAVGGGFFQAMAAGVTAACASIDGERICAPVEVKP